MNQVNRYYDNLLESGEKVAPLPLAGILAAKLQNENIKYSMKLCEDSKTLFLIKLLNK